MVSSNTKKGNGRQSVKMEKIEKKSKLQVTFSKRRNGLFKKAFELSILTQAQVAAVVFSPGGKVYSFGHPSVEIVADKLLRGNSQSTTNTQQQERDQRKANIEEMIGELEDTKNKLEAEKKRGKELDRILEQGQKTICDDGKDLWKLKQSFESMKDFQAQVEREIRLSSSKNYSIECNGTDGGGGGGRSCGGGGGNGLAEVNDTP